MSLGCFSGRENREMKKILLVTFSDNADHQDTLFGMYEEVRKRKKLDVYLLCIKTPKVQLQQSDHTWLVNCPERPGITKKTFNLPQLFSIVHCIHKEHFDAIYFESLHTWNLPIMMMAGKAKTYQVIHEVIPHEGDSQVKMVDLMNKAVVKFADTMVLRNRTFIQDLIDRYGISAGRVKYLELWRRYPGYTAPVHSGRILFFGRINPYKGADNLLEIVRLCPDIQFDVIGRVDPQMKDVVEQLTIRDGGITRITRTVHPNDVMDIVVVGASGESTTSTARSDYSLFYEIYQDQQNYKNGQLAQIPALTGSEVTGSQFKHRYVGTSATDTVYASDLRKCKKASDVASILATAWGSTPAAVISSTASFIFDQMLQSMSSDCYKVTISSITYEVLFSYDNSYYTHCYHQTVKEYKSNGSLIRSKTDYYQAIGG